MSVNIQYEQFKNRVQNDADIFLFIQETKTQINFDNHKNKILILGNAGSGKSTLTHYLAGDNDNLISESPDGLSRSTSGQYVIRDLNGKINKSAITSEAIFPELMLRNEIAFYDCPGFNHIRSPFKNIASTYLTKELLDSAEGLKFVFTVNHSSVTKGNDRFDFVTLVKHITDLIKDIDKYRDSIILIATKVNTNVTLDCNGVPTFVPDNVIINDIAQFLEGVKHDMIDMQNDITSTQNQNFCGNGIKLINILLTRNNDMYTKLGIFRKPIKEGHLSEIEILQNGKKDIEKILNENTNYTFKNVNDFGFTVSDSSRNFINDSVIKIKDQITIDITNVVQQINKYYRKKINDFKDLYQLRDELNTEFNSLSEIIDESIQLTQAIEFLKEFVVKITMLYSDIHIIEVKKSILRKIDYIDFLQLVSDNKTLNTTPLNWFKPLHETKNYLNDLNRWYIFLIHLYEKLSIYEVQNNVERYNVADLSDWGSPDRPQGIIINQDNIDQFLEKVNETLVKRHYTAINLKNIDAFELEALNDVLNITLKRTTRISYPENGMVITGRYIKFSDILLSEDRDIKYLNVFASNKVFIDRDFEKVGKKLQLTVIAPKWEVINTRKINLNGASGPSQTKANNGPRADKWYLEGGKGSDGKPGLPGGAAGNFLGIGMEFINSSGLTITADGGQGGKGQDGGDGQRGIIDIVTEEILFSSIIKVHVGKGGDGGNGGIGGLGGAKGDIKIVNLNTFVDEPNISNQCGPLGLGGKGGIGGTVPQRNDFHSSLPLIDTNDFRTFFFKSPGDNGSDNYNDINRIQPEPSMIYQKHTFLVNSYKDFVIDNLDNKINIKMFTQFLDQLSTTTNFKVLDFINELQMLENKYFQLKDKINFIPLYKSLLSRIKIYVENSEDEGEELSTHKKILSYLYTATLSKIFRINDNFENNLIIDIKAYLDSATRNISDLIRINNQVSIDTYRSDYQRTLDKKINEANDFITNQVNPEINNIQNEIELRINSLIDEIVELQRKAENNKQELIQKRNELNKTLMLRLFFGVCKGVGQVTECLGLWSKTTYSIFKSTKMVAEKFVLDDNEYQQNQLDIPQGVKNMLQITTDNIKSIKIKNMQVVREQIELLTQEVNNNHYLADNTAELSNLQTDLNASANDQLDFEKYTTIVCELKKYIKKKIKFLEDKKRNCENDNVERQDIENTLSMLKCTNKALRVAETSTDIYMKYKVDKAKLDAISEAINQSEQDINEITQYKNCIYSYIVPILEIMRNDINNLELDSRFKVYLDVTRWKIQSVLRDIKLQIKQITKGFEIQKYLVRSIEKLDESISVLINIYNRIENYQEQKILADFIANTHSSASNGINTNDVEYESIIHNLDSIIKSNIILDQYERAINAFKQYIFPFADLYLREYNLPPNLELGNNTDDLLSHAIEKIESLKNRLLTSDTLILPHDTYLFKGNFRSNEYNTTEPFFVWDNETYKDVIGKLLVGKEVSLKAEIAKGVNKNAVKFNLIEVIFKSTDDTLQNELEQILKGSFIQLIHLGNSYYRCNEKLYVFSSDSQSISYSFEKDATGNPLHVNEVYSKIAHGDLVLSPYAMWNIKIIPKNAITFENLNKFINKVDLHLSGSGQYVENEYFNQHTLENYYRVDATISGNEITYSN